MDKNNNQKIIIFDKDHSTFRANVFLNIMSNYRKKFINSVRFTGDENFTIAKQRAMLKMLFDKGIAGVYNQKKKTITNIENSENYKMIVENDFAKDIVTQIINEQKIDNCIPISVSPNRWGEDERIISGQGLTAPRHNVDKKTFTVTKEDTAIIVYNENYMSGYAMWLPIVYMFATGELVIKKRLTLTDPKIAVNNSNNSNTKNKFDDVYDPTGSTINISASQASVTGKKDFKIDVNSLLSEKIAKLNMSSNETINDLLEFINEYKKHWYHAYGIRINNNDKSDRSITDDFKSEEVHFANMENDFKEQCEMFIEDYKRINGVQLTAEFISDKVLNEIKEHEKELSGRNGDNTENKEEE